jgi:hypothetical protein
LRATLVSFGVADVGAKGRLGRTSAPRAVPGRH